jgi:hypothetical protein
MTENIRIAKKRFADDTKNLKLPVDADILGLKEIAARYDRAYLDRIEHDNKLRKAKLGKMNETLAKHQAL